MARKQKRSSQFRNPFLASGALRLVRSVLVFLIGLVLLFKGLVAFRNDDSLTLILCGFAAIILISSGLTGLFQAFNRLTGFEPDPRSPADLVERQKNGTKVSSVGKFFRYGASDLSELLSVGTPPENQSKSGPLARLAQLFLPDLRYAPPEIRLLIESIFACILGSLVVAGLAIFFIQASKAVGLQLSATGLSVFWWFLVFVLMTRWRLGVKPSTLSLTFAQMRNASPGTLGGLIFFIALLVVSAVLASAISMESISQWTGISLEEITRLQDRLVSGKSVSSAVTMTVFVFVLAAGLIGCTLFFWFVRQKRLHTLSGELDENVTSIRFQRDGVGNPQHFNEAFQTALQAGRQNDALRVYNMGKTIYVETQPEQIRAPLSKAIPFIAEGAGNILLLVSAFIIGFGLPDLQSFDEIQKVIAAGNEPTEDNLISAWKEMAALGPWLLKALIFGGFGKWFLGVSEVFLGETNFRSVLMRASLSGSETSVQQSIGKAAFDSFETAVKVPYMNGVLEAESVTLHTCSFVRPNEIGLMGPRSILEFGAENGLLKATVDEAVRSLDELRFIPQLQRPDAEAIEQAAAINRTHAQAVYHNNPTAIGSDGQGNKPPGLLPDQSDED